MPSMVVAVVEVQQQRQHPQSVAVQSSAVPVEALADTTTRRLRSFPARKVALLVFTQLALVLR